MVASCLLGDGNPGLLSLLLLDDILNLAHQGLHVDQEEGGWGGGGREVISCLVRVSYYNGVHNSVLDSIEAVGLGGHAMGGWGGGGKMMYVSCKYPLSTRTKIAAAIC